MVIAVFDKTDESSPLVDSDVILRYYEDRKHVVSELSLGGLQWEDRHLDQLERIVRDKNPARAICLQRLSLSNNLLTAKSGDSLAHILKNVHTLRELDLSDNRVEADGLDRLSDSLESDFCVLKTLNLFNNHLGSRCSKHIASILRKNRSIVSLNIGKNQLNSKKCIDKLVDALMENTHLQKLDLSYNKMTNARVAQLARVLDPELSVCPLEELDLSSNLLTEVGVSQVIGAIIKGGNTRLLKLNLSNNRIGLDGAYACALCCQYSHTLQELVLSSCGIGDEGAELIRQGLGNQDLSEASIQHLDLSWNSIHNSGAMVLALLLEENDSLQVLNLASNGIGSAGAQALSWALPANQKLKELNLSGNQIRDFGAVKLAEAICRDDCTLETLEWEDCRRITDFGRARLEAAFRLRQAKGTWLGNTLRAIKTRRYMPSLSLKLGDEELICICKHLEEHRPNLPFVSFKGPDVTNRGVEFLAKTVISQNCIPLKRFYLQNTHMGDRGAAAISQALLHNDNLTVLSLSSCEITNEGASFLSNILRRNPNLQRLDLKKNRIGDRGAHDLFTAICDEPAHYTMTSLNLSQNQLTDRCFCPLVTFAPLKEVHLGDNMITDHGALDLAKICMKTPNLGRLDIHGNRITNRGIQALRLFIPDDIKFFESGNQQPP